jgi:hypothetical protein
VIGQREQARTLVTETLRGFASQSLMISIAQPQQSLRVSFCEVRLQLLNQLLVEQANTLRVSLQMGHVAWNAEAN